MKSKQIRSVSTRLTPLRCVTGLLAFALACCSALCIYFYMTPAHASSSGHLTSGTTMSAQAPMDDTETETPSQTPTRTSTPAPSPSPTGTSTPVLSPSPTSATTPVPTSTRPSTATVRPSSTAPAKATSQQVPASVNVTTGGQQTPMASPVSRNGQSYPARRGASSSGAASPIVPLCIGLGSLFLLGLLFKGRRMLRCPARPLRSPDLPLAGSVSVNRARNSRQQTSFTGQRAFDLSSSWNGILTRDELEQVMQQRRIANSIPPFPWRESAANDASFAGELTSVSFYSYPGVPRSGGFVAQGDGQPAIAPAPVPPATPPAPRTQPSSADNTGSGDPSVQATVQSYIY